LKVWVIVKDGKILGVYDNDQKAIDEMLKKFIKEDDWSFFLYEYKINTIETEKQIKLTRIDLETVYADMEHCILVLQKIAKKLEKELICTGDE